MNCQGPATAYNRVYRILYLLPDRLLTKNKLLELQKEYSKTYIKDLVLPSLCDPARMDKLKDLLNDFEKVFSGLINTFNSSQHDVLGRVAAIWYAFTKTSHASLGPRVGNFTEQLIRYWIKKHRENVDVYVNTVLTRYFIERFRVPLRRGRRKVDFIIEDRNTKTLSLVELRESEHTGGRTGQESLMDKLTQVLGWLEEPNIKLREILMRNNYHRLELAIAILFAEKDHRLLSQENYNEGRFTSLRDYILDNRHIGGKLKELVNNHGYEISLDECRSFTRLRYTNNTREQVDQSLKEYRRICLRKNDFEIELSILWGDEFFNKYIGKSFYELLSEAENEVADDIWLFFTVALNEAKILKEFGSSNLEKIFKFLIENKDLLNTFNQLYNNQNITTVMEYFDRLNELLDKIAKLFIQYAENNNIEIRLLETNDFLKQYIYLKQLCIVALALYKSGTCLIGDILQWLA